MFDLGWTELLVIGIVALIVIGPKDLPLMFRRVGQFIGKARSMAREFSRAMDDAAEEAGVKDVSKTLKAASNPLKTSIDQVKQATSEFAAYDPEAKTGKPAAQRKEAAQKIHAEARKRSEEKRAAEQKDKTSQDSPAAAEQTSIKKTTLKKKSVKTTADATPAKMKAAKKTTEKKVAAPKKTPKTNSADDADF